MKKHMEGMRVRRLTGAVDLMVAGDRPKIRSAKEALKDATQTEFARANALTERGVLIEPSKQRPNVVAVALSKGVVLNRITISGETRGEYAALEKGTYYTCLDLVEGPELDEWRWLARIIDSKGSVRGSTFSVQVKQIVDFHPDKRADHSRDFPSMYTHGVGDGKLAKDAGFTIGVWEVTCTGWEPIGTNADGSLMCQASCTCIGRIVCQ